MSLTWLTVCAGWMMEVRAGLEPDFLMYSDPLLVLPEPIEDFNPQMGVLWMQALNRPEADMQRMAAETIARAHEYGIPDLAKAVPRLEEILLAESSQPAARFAAAHALITLDARASGDKLFEASQAYGADLRQLVEPALAAWGNASAKSVWLERVSSGETRYRDLVLAMRSLGEIQEQSAVSDLLSITVDPTRDSGVRLEAATAAGRIADAGLEQDAADFVAGAQPPLFISELCAVRLLVRHTSEEAQRLLAELAVHDEPAVAAAALQRLNEIDYSLVLPLAEQAMQNADVRVRRQGVLCYLQLPELSHIGPLSKVLADPNPGLRAEVSEGLFRLSEMPELNESIREAGMQMLAGDRWQGQQQSSLLLGSLEHQPAADRLVELLDSPRVEVRLPASWALRKVAVPESAAAIIAKIQQLTELRQVSFQPGLDEQVAYLIEAVGVLKSEDAVPVLERYVPKNVNRNNLSRGATMWALGRIYEGVGNEEIERALNSRIMDFSPQPLETTIVKAMAAVSLGRLKSEKYASSLRQVARTDGIDMRLEVALGWAVREMTGEELPPPEPDTVGQGSWFLEPVQ